MKYRVTVFQVLSGQTIVTANSSEEAETFALDELAENDYIEDVETTYVRFVRPLTTKEKS